MTRRTVFWHDAAQIVVGKIFYRIEHTRLVFYLRGTFENKTIVLPALPRMVVG